MKKVFVIFFLLLFTNLNADDFKLKKLLKDLIAHGV